MAKVDIDTNDDVLLADVNRYTELAFKLSKSSAEQTELSGLQSTLADYLLIASDYNDLVTQQNANINLISDNTDLIEDNASAILLKKDKTDFLSGTASIPTTGWSASSTDYDYEVNVTITSITTDFTLDWYIDVDDQLVAKNAELSNSGTVNAGSITFYANTAPTSAISFDYKAVK